VAFEDEIWHGGRHQTLVKVVDGMRARP
jgi:hypothetical protein